MASIVAPAEVGGLIRWDLPESVSELEVTTNVEVVNNTAESQVYAVSVIWANIQNIDEFYSWNVVTFESDGDEYNAFGLAPNMVYPFSLTLAVGELNVYAARVRLHCLTGDLIYRDEYVDELIVYFATGGGLLEMMGPMMAMMMMGVMMSMSRGLIPEEEEAPARVEIVAPEYRELPPGRE